MKGKTEQGKEPRGIEKEGDPIDPIGREQPIQVVDPRDRPDRRELLARTGIDLLLVAFAAVGWWQLWAQPAGASSRADAVRVLAPGLLLAASATLALRLVRPALRAADSPPRGSAR